MFASGHSTICTMSTRTAGRLIAWTAMLACATPAVAHHSFAPYEAKATRTVVGTVASIQWANPHVTFSVLVDLKDGSKRQEWKIVTSSPAILKRFGWTGESVRPGDRVSLDCNPLSDGSYGGRLHTLTLLASGTVLRTKLSPTEQ
jgi:uncharacterized protein DUF6152